MQQNIISEAWRPKLFSLLHIVSDYLAILLAEKTALFLQGMFRVQASQMMILPWDYQYIYIPGMFLLLLSISESYKFNRPSLEVARDVGKGCCVAILMYMLVIFLMRNSMQVSRYYAVCFFAFMVLYIGVFRNLLEGILKKCPNMQEPVLLLGAGKTAEILLDRFQRDNCYNYRVIGILDDHPVSERLPKEYPLLGTFEEASGIIQKLGVRTLIMAVPGLPEEKLKRLLYSIQHLTDTIVFTPGLVGSPLGSVEISTLFVEQLTVIKSKNNLSRWYNRWVKFAFDMVVTAIGTILISPMFLALCICVAIDNKGKVIFAHQRVGRNGKLFSCYKFQTMIPNAQQVLEEYLKNDPQARLEWETNFKLSNDPRVTKLGAVLRKTSLDELPQIFNVLKGEMSLVGPRPVVQAELAKYGDNKKEYLMVRPGITGMWQASGRSDTTYEERVAMDTWYVRNWSLWIDLKYLYRTFAAVISKKGAY